MNIITYYVKEYDIILMSLLCLGIAIEFFRVKTVRSLKSDGEEVKAAIIAFAVRPTDRTSLNEGQDVTAREHSNKNVVLESEYVDGETGRSFKRKSSVPEWLYRKLWKKSDVNVLHDKDKPRRPVIRALLSGKILKLVLFLVLLYCFIWSFFMFHFLV